MLMQGRVLALAPHQRTHNACQCAKEAQWPHQLDMWSDIMQLMANFLCVVVISMYVDISYNNVLRIYCCYSMQLATIVSTLVYTSIHLCATLNLCSRMRTTVQCSSTIK